ncbi:MAG: alpha,alpha-phosphotrehalase [Hungatella hathewayi]|nr:alpha,alpha-phosphotrehalase [Hungatella hathewayi]
MENFKNSTVYQIYIKSFKDTSGNGFGDIRGITEKLDYLRELGVDYVWITPFFKSPQRDNGYDVSDYTAVDSMFGTMEDVEELIAQAESRGIGCMFDMVFNHTSTEHEWFQRALRGEPEYMDYYIFRDGEPDAPPTNWQSKFGGPAWEYVPHLKKWYLHLFDVTQADLNWENPQVREELKQVIRFWKEKGVKGFRFDVVNLISKPELFENDDIGDGRRFYTDGPHVHEYLKELVRDTGIGEMVTVGEMSSTSLENCVRYTRPEEHEFSMCFNFHHLKVDYKDGNKWEPKEPDHEELKRLLMQWQEGMQAEQGWNAMFWCNHDQPRAVSRFGDDKKYWKESAKMLATCIHLLRGTPYIFQGEELGMTNAGFKDIGEYRDVESINYYEIMQSEGKTRKEALDILAARSRDNGRTPMQWDGTEQAGFTDSVPWIGIPANHVSINAEAEMADEDSIWNYHRKLIALRKEYEVIADGGIEFLFQTVPDLFAYSRFGVGEEILVFNNLSGRELVLPEAVSLRGCSRLIGNYKDGHGESLVALRPYESVVYRVIKRK